MFFVSGNSFLPIALVICITKQGLDKSFLDGRLPWQDIKLLHLEGSLKEIFPSFEWNQFQTLWQLDPSPMSALAFCWASLHPCLVPKEVTDIRLPNTIMLPRVVFNKAEEGAGVLHKCNCQFWVVSRFHLNLMPKLGSARKLPLRLLHGSMEDESMCTSIANAFVCDGNVVPWHKWMCSQQCMFLTTRDNRNRLHFCHFLILLMSNHEQLLMSKKSKQEQLLTIFQFALINSH